METTSVSGSSSSAAAPAPAKRKVMVVADAGRESSGALQWALTHAVLDQDEIVLLHVDTPNTTKRGGPFSGFLRRPSTGSGGGGGGVGVSCVSAQESAGGVGNYDFLDEMRSRCRQAQPRVPVQVTRVEMEDNDKAATILAHTRTLGVDLLVIGQPRRSSFLGGRLSGGSAKNLDVVEYLIENSKCLCVGVQKKGQNGGYVLNTKTHKNFWLLA